MPVEGAIAKIVDRSTVVINRGSKDGVKLRMKFVIFAEADDVTDPQTGKPLGKWELVKGYVQAAHVQEAMATCSAAPPPGRAEADQDSTKTLSSEMIAVSRLDRRRSGSGKLAVDPSQMAGRPGAEPVSVGDRVRSLEEG